MTAGADTRLLISLTRQRLEMESEGRITASYAISTSRYGPGERLNSECTPRGLHVIRARIGSGLPLGAVFRGRRFTGEVYSPELAARWPGRDWILTRILWLGGLETGRNRGGQVDSMRRYIYIHGTPDTEPMSVPWSHGCVRMRNADIAQLFDRVAPGTLVNLQP